MKLFLHPDYDFELSDVLARFYECPTLTKLLWKIPGAPTDEPRLKYDHDFADIYAQLLSEEPLDHQQLQKLAGLEIQECNFYGFSVDVSSFDSSPDLCDAELAIQIFDYTSITFISAKHPILSALKNVFPQLEVIQ